MKTLILALFTGLWTVSAMATLTDSLPKKALCWSGLESSLCEPLARLEEAEKQWVSALAAGSEEWGRLNQQREEVYISEVEPYIDKTCFKGFVDGMPHLMIVLCSGWEQLKENEERLVTDWQNRPDRDHILETVSYQDTVSYQSEIRFQKAGTSADTQFQTVRVDYAELREDIEDIMAALCRMEQTPTTKFCNLQKQISEHRKRYYQPAENNLRHAAREMENAVSAICERIQRKQGYLDWFYGDDLCGDKKNRR